MEKEKEEHSLFAEVKKNKIRKRRARFENIWSEDEKEKEQHLAQENDWSAEEKKNQEGKTHFVGVG